MPLPEKIWKAQKTKYLRKECTGYIVIVFIWCIFYDKNRKHEFEAGG